MAGEEMEILARKATADVILERAASQLKEILHQVVAELVPFPPFPGSFFTYAIEVEPGAAARADRGCVVVCPDGELYELIIKMDFSGPFTDLFSVRREETKRLDLPPQEYIPYAYNAICEVTRILLERQGRGGAGS